MSTSLPGLSFRLFGFSVTIGLDFLLIAVLLGFGARPGIYLVEWLVVLAVSILVHELGHAFALRMYGIRPVIRLWGMGGLTSWGFALPPRKSILVSAAGPLVGIPIGLAAMVLRPWLPGDELFQLTMADVVLINFGWAIVNLLPIAGLDGGNIVTSAFQLAMGPRGRSPGLVVVAIGSIAVAIGAVVIGFVYLALVVLLFGLMNPGPYLELQHVLSAGRSPRRSMAGSGSRRSMDRPRTGGGWRGRRSDADGGDDAGGGGSRREPAPETGRGPDRRPALSQAVDARRAFAEIYAETVAADAADAADELPDGSADVEHRPVPLLPDVSAMLARRDDAGLVRRLAAEPDPLAILGIVARTLDGGRIGPVLEAAHGLDAADREAALLKLQVALHSLGRFGDSLRAADAQRVAGVEGAAGARAAVVEARSAARLGDRRRTRQALERVMALGPVVLSDGALGDIVRLGPDRDVADLLARLRGARTT